MQMPMDASTALVSTKYRCHRLSGTLVEVGQRRARSAQPVTD
jgi:hypothetical protein